MVHSLLPPASAVDVIESEPWVCVSALSRPNRLTYEFVCASITSTADAGGKKDFWGEGTGGMWTLMRFHLVLIWWEKATLKLQGQENKIGLQKIIL